MPTQYVTGNKRITVTTNEAGDPESDPVSLAKKQTAEAQAREESVTAAQAQADATTKANDARGTAKEASTAAFKAKPNTASARTAHHRASLANGDAAKALAVLAGEGSGNDLNTRAKAKALADAHAAQAKTHAMHAGAGTMRGGSTLNSGAGGVVVDVMPTVNAWTEEARAASAAARRASTKAEGTKGKDAVTLHRIAAQHHSAAMHSHWPHNPAIQQAHLEASQQHSRAALFSQPVERSAGPGVGIKHRAKAAEAAVAAKLASDQTHEPEAEPSKAHRAGTGAHRFIAAGH